MCKKEEKRVVKKLANARKIKGRKVGTKIPQALINYNPHAHN